MTAGKLRARWLHLGFGAFARAHPLFVLHRGQARVGGDWGVVVARLNSGLEDLAALDAAQGRYHVLEADAGGMRATEVACVMGTCHPLRDGPQALSRIIAAPELAVISLTITEKGYCLGPEGLDREHPAIRADLHGTGPARSAIGVLVEGLAARRAAGQGGVTLLSCDNLPENGRKLARAVQDFAGWRDHALADWIAAHCRFPCAMVDRIVPAMTAAGEAAVSAHMGRHDPAAVICEPYLDWVIEDDFAGDRPPLAEGGALLVAQVAPYEIAKLRMLNGAHSFLALLGGQAGFDTVDACMADPVLATAIRRFHRSELGPTVPPVPGIDLEAYGAALRHRFENPRLHHRTVQIAADTSQKLPQRIIAPLRWHLDRNGIVPPLMALLLASWVCWLRGRGDGGRVLTLNDPSACALQAQMDALGGADAPRALAIDAVLGWRGVFPGDLATDARLRLALDRALAALDSAGALAALRDLIAEERE